MQAIIVYSFFIW